MTEPTSTPDLRLKSILESLLLVSEKPIPFAQLQEVLQEYSE
jgi:hypothetical protein